MCKLLTCAGAVPFVHPQPAAVHAKLRALNECDLEASIGWHHPTPILQGQKQSKHPGLGVISILRLQQFLVDCG